MLFLCKLITNGIFTEEERLPVSPNWLHLPRVPFINIIIIVIPETVGKIVNPGQSHERWPVRATQG